MVGAVRFELTTSCTRNKRATRLRYAPTSERSRLPARAAKGNVEFEITGKSLNFLQPQLEPIRLNLCLKIRGSVLRHDADALRVFTSTAMMRVGWSRFRCPHRLNSK